MKTTFISTAAMGQATRASIMKLQAQLAVAQKEVASGRRADVGLSLGYETGQAVALRQEHARLTTIVDTNGPVATRLDATQATLQAMATSAQSFLDQLVAARSGGGGPAVLQPQAKAALASFIDGLNTAVNGSYLFAGINADVRPITEYDQTPPAANKQAVATAFMTAFGVAQSDPAASAITAGSMQTFLDTAFAGLFDPAGWSGAWSAASDQPMRSRISTSELIETSTSANEPAFRKLAMAFTMLTDLGVENLNQSAYQVVVDTAMRNVAEALDGLTALQADLGMAQERIAGANARMSAQIDIMVRHINVLEGVDLDEASTRVAALLNQVEAAYAMTARIHQLSLLNYL
jgi:flagellar hook-associated protein 3 FlgL